MFKRFLEGTKDRFIRAKELATAAIKSGPRSVTPELGVGEFLRGFTGANIHEADAKDPKFVANLKEGIETNVPEDKKGLFEKDLKADKDRQKQEWLAKTANSLSLIHI